MWWVQLKVSFTTLGEVSVVFDLVRASAFLVLCAMSLVREGCYKLPARTKDSTVGGMGRTRAILRQTRRRVLKIEKGDKIR